MRIAIVGAHNVGKTTLAELLSDSLPGYTLTMEPYHELTESGYEFSEMPDAVDFVMQFEHALKQIATLEKDVIFDRCPFDILAYVHAVDPTRDLQNYFREMQRVIAELDLIVFVPIEDPDLIPWQKSNFPKLRLRVDDILKEWIADFDIEVIEVSGTTLQRKDQVLRGMS
ncbi:ATP/GTP-binding protein [Pedobacter sp. GR22-6]|uniref:ATP/GTP-binding protein n=1 Tax=Pedobacter sp. GR22-6 TaxID=3127957 RepID=UPI00307D98B0